jgi:hypothetical protein
LQKKAVILSGSEVLRTAASFLRSVIALRRSEPESKDLARLEKNMGKHRSHFSSHGRSEFSVKATRGKCSL